MPAFFLGILAAVPAVGAGWWLRTSHRSTERPNGRLNIRVCGVLIAAGTFSFALVDCLALGVSVREGGGLALWAASFVTSFTMLPMMVASVVNRKVRSEYLHW